MIDSITLDFNKRSDPVLKTEYISDDTIQRIVTTAIPFLNLHPATAQATSVGLGLYNSYKIFVDLIQEENAIAIGAKTILLALTVTITAFAVIFPLGQFVVSNTYGLLIGFYHFGEHLCSLEWQQAGADALRLAMQGIYIASVLLATTELILLSILLFAIEEGYTSYEEFSRGHYFEGIAHLLLAGIRAHGAKPHAQKAYRDHFGQKLTQEKWEQIYAQMSKVRDVEQIFIEQDISSRVKNINFTKTAALAETAFSNIDFQNCDFTNVNFSRSRFSRVTADSCLFKKSVWIESIIESSRFSRSDFSYSYFNGSHLTNFTLDRCTLLETSFLGAAAEKSIISRSNLTDCLLLDAREQFKLQDCTPNVLTRPVVGIVWEFEINGTFAPLMNEAIRENGAIPVLLQTRPRDVDGWKLSEEVEKTLDLINKAPPQGMLSPASELIRRVRPGSEMAKIVDKVESYRKYLDGILLPGGEDILPASYGAVAEAQTHHDFDQRRLVLEYALLDAAHKHRIPTMGICRGSQLINIYFGGTLKQDVAGQWFTQQPMEFAESSRREWAQEFFGENFSGFSAHHQASDRIGKDLEVVLKADEIPKLILSKDGNFIGSQIHPEIYISLKKNSSELKEFASKLDVLKIIYQFNPQKMEEIRHWQVVIKNNDNLIEKNQNLYRFFIAKAEKRRGNEPIQTVV